jgi:Lsr2
MAQHTIVQLTDDLDGSSIKQGSGETVKFLLDGVEYEIDLSDRNSKKLRGAFAPFVAASRRMSGPRGRAARSATKAGAPTVDTAAVRVWAAENGYEVSARGRISAEVTAAYTAAAGK